MTKRYEENKQVKKDEGDTRHLVSNRSQKMRSVLLKVALMSSVYVLHKNQSSCSVKGTIGKQRNKQKAQ